MRGWVARLILSFSVPSLVMGAPGAAWSAEPMDRQALYLANCSNCHGVVTTVGHSRLDAKLIPVAAQLAVALPYGPTLNGVLGRKAGTVPGYQYSRAFLSALGGVVWTRATLDRWISDSRAWVPDAIMVYRQPDPAIRARIIDYLEHPTANPASRDATRRNEVRPTGMPRWCCRPFAGGTDAVQGVTGQTQPNSTAR